MEEIVKNNSKKVVLNYEGDKSPVKRTGSISK